MKKTITLLQNYGSLTDREPFLCDVGESLALEFQGREYVLKDCSVTLENGISMTRRCGNEFEVPTELIHPGTLNVKLNIMKQGQIVKSFRIEPILIRELGDGVEAMPQIAALEARISALEAKDFKREEEFGKFKIAAMAQFERIITNHNKFADEIELIKSEMSL